MNRLIIIGNGFDLAHGLKTSYHDFLLDYLKKALNDVYYKWSYNDDLLSIEKTTDAYRGDWFENYQNPFELYKKAISVNLKFTFKSVLWRSIIVEPNTNWVDIELAYYSILKNNLTKGRKPIINQLNSDLNKIRTLLINYLIEASSFKDVNDHLIDQYLKQFTYRFNSVKPFRSGDKIQEYYNLYLINFNYTSTLELYRNLLSRYNAQIFNIHGELDYPNSIIFGFGDELDKYYQEIEDLNDNDYFEHIKSFNYLKSRDYRKIFALIESDDEPFEVLIFGHSLGISDRTMLSQILNNPNLQNVQIFYHEKKDGSNDFRTKTFEISRHFKDKGKMRKQIQSFYDSEPMPQLDKIFENSLN